MKIATIVLTLAVGFSLQATPAKSQDDDFKFFDASWKKVKEKNAVYLLRIRQLGDTLWQYSYYNIYGPLVRIETYQDKKGTIRQGLFAWYNEEGWMDSSGYYYQGLPDKNWIYPDSTGKVHKAKYYDKGIPLSEKEHSDRLKANEIVDPAYPDFSRLSPESYFPGGPTGWLEYLNQNLHYPARAINNRVQGIVLAFFRVDPTGEIHEIQILHSVELSIDDEAIRLFMSSPGWVPAIRFDRKVPSYKAQPVLFRLEPM